MAQNDSTAGSTPLPVLPSYDDCCDTLSQDRTALMKFIFDYEPAGDEGEIWRSRLVLVLKDAINGKS